MRRPLADRFWEKVDKSGDCWLWTGARTTAGYGEFYPTKTMVYAHRFSEELARGPLAPGEMVLHKCDTPPCVNPAHLRRGSHQENMNDMWSRGRGNPGRLLGSRHWRTKLTEDDVRELRLLWAQGASRGELAARYDTTPGNVYDIASRRTWKHVA